MRLSALSLLLTRAAAWTADGYPDCSATQGPACFPNRRAPNHHSLLNSLFNKWCSDKGTYWLSKHNYGAAYDTVLRPIRRRARHLLELGVGDETAGSLNAWREYFPRAHLWIADIDTERFRNTAQFAWASRQKRRHGCFDDADAWRDPRVHALFGVDSSNFTALRALPLPPVLDLIIDDAAHVLSHQVAALEALWPRLGAGGYYIVEDLTVGALSWLHGAAAADQLARVPTNNSGCGHECQYAQRPADHPFLKRLLPAMVERRAAEDALRRGAPLPRTLEKILDNNEWFWASTGVHVGGGLDSSLIIHKTEARSSVGPAAAVAPAAAAMAAGELKAAAAPAAAAAAAAPVAAAPSEKDDDDADDAPAGAEESARLRAEVVSLRGELRAARRAARRAEAADGGDPGWAGGRGVQHPGRVSLADAVSLAALVGAACLCARGVAASSAVRACLGRRAERET